MILAPFKAQAQNQTFCAPATVSNLANPGPTGFTGQWFADASGGTALAPTTALAWYLLCRTKSANYCNTWKWF
jgi:hypothetical protein